MLGYTSGTTGRPRAPCSRTATCSPTCSAVTAGLALDAPTTGCARPAAVPHARPRRRPARHAAHRRQRGPAPPLRRRRGAGAAHADHPRRCSSACRRCTRGCWPRPAARGAAPAAAAVRLRLRAAEPQPSRGVEAALGQRILERYGMTETIMNVSNPYDGERAPGTVGFPLPGGGARVDVARSRAAGGTARSWCAGRNVFAGYWQRPEATAEAFTADGWFRTGDLGALDDRRLPAHRRPQQGADHQRRLQRLPARGRRTAARPHPASPRWRCVGVPDPDLGEQVVAVVVPRAGARPTRRGAASPAAERLASFKKPRRVRLRGALPRNALGKVQKNLLREACSRPLFTRRQSPERSGTFRHWERKTPRFLRSASSVPRRARHVRWARGGRELKEAELSEEPGPTGRDRIRPGHVLNGGGCDGGPDMMTGSPGTGKTIFGNQLCFSHAADGGRPSM